MSAYNKLKVGIYINTLTGGGRRIVTDRIVHILNQLEIIPDLITYRVNKSYNPGSLNFRLKLLSTKLPGRPKWLYEYKVISLNRRLCKLADQYDFFINSNNSILDAPEVPTIVYMHFPRNARYTDDFAKRIPRKERGFQFSIARLLVRRLYGSSIKVPRDFTILANSEFTRDMFLKQHKMESGQKVNIIYPPVRFSKINGIPKEKNQVVSLGRFSETKHQLEQIEVARKCPNHRFHLIGFVGDQESKKYYQNCLDRIKDYQLNNVFLHPNITEEQKERIMVKSQYFIHTLHNEPFGISTVEAIAKGCIPIVPNSGGQIEVVPFPELRFDRIEQIPEMLNSQNNEEATISKLKEHIDQFSLDSFDHHFSRILKKYING